MRRLSLTFVLLTMLAGCATGTARSACLKTGRGDAAREFKRENRCPGGPDVGSTRRCAGYEAHHVVPLMGGGADEVGNLVWLTTEQHRALHSAMICRCDAPKG